MKEKHAYIFILIILLLASVLGGCATEPDAIDEPGAEEVVTEPEIEKDRLIIGTSIMNSAEPFYYVIEEGWAAAAAAADIDVEVIFTSAEGDLSRQISQTEDYIVSNVDAIILCPADSAGIIPAVEKANEAGIPIVLADINSEGGEVASFIASDNYEGGALAAHALAEELGSEGQVIIIGSETISSVYDRLKGFMDTLDQEYPDMEMVQMIDAGYARDTAMTMTEDMLLTWPELVGIFAAYGADAGLGALAAVEASGRDVVIVNFDAVDESIQEIYNNSPYLIADVAQFTFRIGYESMEAAIAAALGESVQPENIIDVELITQDDLELVDGKVVIKGFYDID